MWTTPLLERVASESLILSHNKTTLLICTTVFSRVHQIPKDWIVHIVSGDTSKHIENTQITGISSFFVPYSRVVFAYPVKPLEQYIDIFQEVVWFIPDNVGVTITGQNKTIRVVCGQNLSEVGEPNG